MFCVGFRGRPLGTSLRLTQDEVLDQLQLILLLVLQHALEVLLPAGDVDRPDGLVDRLPRGHALHLAP